MHYSYLINYLEVILVLTEAEIRKQLSRDVDWEPEYDISTKDWNLLEAIRDEYLEKLVDSAYDPDKSDEDSSYVESDWDDDEYDS